MNPRDRILTLAQNRHEAHVIAAMLNVPPDEVAQTLAVPTFEPVDVATGIGLNFIALPEGSNPEAMTCDGTYLYWGEYGLNGVGRAKLDGSDVQPEWIKAPPLVDTGTHGVYAVAVDATYAYYTYQVSLSNLPEEEGARRTKPQIRRARLDGTHDGVLIGTLDLIPVSTADDPKHEPQGVIVDDTYIYWAQECGSIGRALLDGTEVEPDWIEDEEGSAYTLVIADEGGRKIYWADIANPGNVGRANIDGTGVVGDFGPSAGTSIEGITYRDGLLYLADQTEKELLYVEAWEGGASVVVVKLATRPQGVTTRADSDFLYFSCPEIPSIGRYRLS